MLCIPANSQDYPEEVWGKADLIVSEISGFNFPGIDYYVTDFKTSNDTTEWYTQAINKAIDVCSEKGGGVVIVPEGIYFTGPIILKSNVRLHISDGAILKFSTNPVDYLPVVETRWEGVDCYNYCPLIYAVNETNIAITGNGILDGQADIKNWWHWKGKSEYGWEEGMSSQLDPAGRPRLMFFEQNNVPVEERIMGEGSYLRPPFIQFLNCNTILIENITIKNSPFWIIHPLLSENIIIRGITAISNGPNNDGCDPESCKNVLIEDCFFETGDDCIAIKSGRNNDGRTWNIPSENIVIRNCRMHDGHGGVVMGSEISGGCMNIFVEDCLMDSPNLERAIRIKTNSFRGGIIENIFIRNITIGEVEEAVLKINCIYEMKDGEKGDHPPLVRKIFLDNIRSEKSKYAIYFQGIDMQNVIHDVIINNCYFNGVEKGNFIEFADFPILHRVYINDRLIKL